MAEGGEQEMPGTGPGTAQPAQKISPVPGWMNNFYNFFCFGVHYLL